ncbi:YbaK/EbsC family protein [Lacimicrobium sp. SS2-24]|uniref:YbaK/EbsC family protein n=1 Tax=Lacimicrobium sp. SS2-24 TaxID=2005569 RepID=UPI000B4B58AD|nr:YbaK/EbsC family protein [Lacimicrobium sp. SS2-24]
MKNPLSASATKVQTFLHRQGYEQVVTELPDSTRSAADAAAALGCNIGQIAKSLVFADSESGDLVLIVASGAHQVDLDKVRQQTGMSLIRADAKRVKAHTGFAIGGIPPIAHDRALKTLLDTSLQTYPRLWAAAGTPHAVFALSPAELSELTGGQWLELKAEAH